MRYFKRPWDEPRGDEYDSLGTTTFYFEVGPDLYIWRQIEVYENGSVLKYDRSHLYDAYGQLAEHPVDLEQDG
jgi:hypothetical protein